MVLLWITVAAGFWGHLRYRRGFNQVRYVDMALPWRWSHYLEEMCQQYVAKGYESLDQGEADKAFYFAQAALAMRPHNADAVVLNSILNYRTGQAANALSGLASHLSEAVATDNQAFLKLFFQWVERRQSDDLAEQASLAALPVQPDDQPLHQMIAFQAAIAAFNRNRYEAAERVIDRWKLRRFAEGVALHGKILWEQNRRETAEGVVRDALTRFPQHDVLYLTLGQMARGSGDLSAALRAATLRQQEHPEKSSPWLDLLYAQHELGRTSDEQVDLAEFFRRFGSDPTALASLMAFALEEREPAIIARIEHSPGFSAKIRLDYDLGLAEAQIGAGEYAAAAVTLRTIEVPKADRNYRLRATVLALQRLAKIGAGDSDEKSMFEPKIGEIRGITPAQATRFAAYLRDQGNVKLAQALIQVAYQPDSVDESLLLAGVQIDLALNDRTRLAEHLPALLKMRKVPRDILVAASAQLNRPGDQPLKAETDELLARSPPAYLALPRTAP